MRPPRAAREINPAVCRAGKRLAVSVQALAANPLEQRFAGHPLHGHQRIKLAVAGGADAVVEVPETDQRGDAALLQVFGDGLVTLASLGAALVKTRIASEPLPLSSLPW